MKNRILLVFILFTLFGCAESQVHTPLITYKNNVLKVTIQSHHTKAELMELKDELKIEFDVGLEFRNV